MEPGFFIQFLMSLAFCVVVVTAEEKEAPGNGTLNDARNRKGKFFNIFQVITFPNGVCNENTGRTGTCFTEQECENMGGANSGSCASGFGVCCVFSVGCYETSNQNCTYFESPANLPEDGTCTAEICPCGDHICQLKLEFDQFTITGPSVNMNTVGFRRPQGGSVTFKAIVDPNKVGVSNFGQCLTDTFSVSNPDGPNPPTICGINTGEHMYVEASDCCNKLSFALGMNPNGVAAVAARMWSIKVTQYSCKYNNLAPQGCTQYFYDMAMDNVQTYNYNNGNGVHLASQDQTICVRRERQFCRICWTAVALTDFAISGSMSYAAKGHLFCCSYAAAPPQTKTKGFDCVQIPFAMTAAGNNQGSHVCGNNKGLAIGNMVCSTRTPFQLNFRSDKWETAPEAATGGQVANNGFMLQYTMDAMNCNQAGMLG